MTRLILTVCLLSLIFIGCTEKQIEENTGSNELYGLASPFQLNHDSSILILSDYFPEGVKVVDVKCSDELDFQLSANGESILLVYKSAPTVPLSNLHLTTSKGEYDILLKKPASQMKAFRLEDNNEIEDVKLKGTFTNWTLVQLNLEDGIWSTELDVPNGLHEYVLQINGSDQPDPNNPYTKSNGMGGSNSILDTRISEASLPMLAKCLLLQGGGEIQALNTDSVFGYWGNTRIQVDSSNLNNFQFNVPEEAKAHERSYLRFYLMNSNGFYDHVLLPLHNGEVITSTDLLDRNDLYTNILYFVFVDRFFDGDKGNNEKVDDPRIGDKANYQGGDIAGVLSKMKEGYFDDLGMTSIWLSPIAQNPLGAWGQFTNPDMKYSGFHGYWPISSSKIDHRLGNPSVLKELLDEAHKRGINVYLDYVANHVHKEHPVYQQHPEWATSLYLPDGSLNTERWDDHRLTTWFDTFLPTMNLMDHEVAEFMTDSALYWLKNFEFDGLRHDATKHIPENFQRGLTKRIKTEIAIPNERTIYQIGETYGSPQLISSYINSGMLDGQFDFNVYNDAVAVFAGGESFERLSSAISNSLTAYGSHHLMGNITGNQDKTRFISYADGSLPLDLPRDEYKRIGWKKTIGIKDSIGYDRLEHFHALNMFLPGIPIVYYGDEIGLPGADDPDNRRMMRFNDLNEREVKLRNRVSDLAEARRNHMSLLYGDLKVYHVSKDAMILRRDYLNESAFYFVNRSDEDLRYNMGAGREFITASGEANLLIMSDGKQLYPKKK